MASYGVKSYGGDAPEEDPLPQYVNIFCYDLITGVTEKINVSSTGEEANADSSGPSITAEGRYVSFTSHADNLISGDTNQQSDIFVRDRVSGTTKRISVSSTGEEANYMSEGSFISPDGNLVAFASSASNLVVGDNNGYYDIFIHNLISGKTTRISVSQQGRMRMRIATIHHLIFLQIMVINPLLVIMGFQWYFLHMPVIWCLWMKMAIAMCLFMVQTISTGSTVASLPNY